jgi:hypothetical protein
MDPSSINSSTFTLMNGSTPVIGSINYSGVEATFSPITPLLPGTLYTATITTGAKDLEGMHWLMIIPGNSQPKMLKNPYCR